MHVSRLCLPAALAFSFPVVHAQNNDAATVVVAGKRADVINKIDRKVYRADADILATTGSAADLLNNIPAVDVDIDGNLSLRGDNSVTVLIDGRPSSQMQGAGRGSALMGFSAADIEQIEVITSPSAEFKPDGAGGIINIVTKKNRKRGATGQLQANLGNDSRHNGSVTGNYNSGAWDLSGSLGNRQDWRRRISDDSTGRRTAPAGLSHQVQDESKERWYGKGTVKYMPNDRQTVGLSLDYAHRNERRISTQQVTPADTSLYQRYGNGGGPRTDASLGLSLDQKLALPGELLSLYLQRSHSDESNLYDYEMVGRWPPLQRDFGRQVFDISKFSSSYLRPDGEGATLKLGYDIEVNHNSFDNWSANGAPQSLLPDPAADNRFRYRQAVNAAYATYAVKHGALESLGGLRFEQVDVRSLQRLSGDLATQHYRKLYPTLNLLYTLNDNEVLTLGYSRRVKKVDPEDLNPYINAADPQNLRQGNPALRPQMTDALELGYRHEAGGTSYGLTAYYRKSRDGDTELLTPLANNVALITKVNMPSSQSGGMEFSAAGKLLPELAYNISGNAAYSEIDTQMASGDKRSTVAFNGKGTLDYQLDTRSRIQVGVNYRGKRLTPQGYNMPFTVVNLGYRFQIDPQWTLVATLSDAFNTQRMRRVYDTQTFSGTYRRQQLGQVAFIGLSYSFGSARKARDAEFNYE